MPDYRGKSESLKHAQHLGLCRAHRGLKQWAEALEGLDGINKMSKSLGNYIGITEPANDIYGKTMSVSDELMFRYYELVSDLSNAEIEALIDKEDEDDIMKWLDSL